VAAVITDLEDISRDDCERIMKLFDREGSTLYLECRWIAWRQILRAIQQFRKNSEVTRREQTDYELELEVTKERPLGRIMLCADEMILLFQNQDGALNNFLMGYPEFLDKYLNDTKALRDTIVKEILWYAGPELLFGDNNLAKLEIDLRTIWDRFSENKDRRDLFAKFAGAVAQIASLGEVPENHFETCAGSDDPDSEAAGAAS
jgi:hypothetical protein